MPVLSRVLGVSTIAFGVSWERLVPQPLRPAWEWIVVPTLGIFLGIAFTRLVELPTINAAGAAQRTPTTPVRMRPRGLRRHQRSAIKPPAKTAAMNCRRFCRRLALRST